MSELTAAQIMLIGFVATVVVGVINLYLKYMGRAPGRRWITVGLYGIAVLLAALWARPLLPDFPPLPAPVEDPSAYAVLLIAFLGQVVVFLGQLIAAASSVVGFATLVYNTLLKSVFDRLGWELMPQPGPQA